MSDDSGSFGRRTGSHAFEVMVFIPGRISLGELLRRRCIHIAQMSRRDCRSDRAVRHSCVEQLTGEPLRPSVILAVSGNVQGAREIDGERHPVHRTSIVLGSQKYN
jgi:hypothetical protein